MKNQNKCSESIVSKSDLTLLPFSFTSSLFRKMMDSGQLDFYQHSTLCTNTCRSTKFDILINNTRFPPDGTGLTIPTSSQGEWDVGSLPYEHVAQSTVNYVDGKGRVCKSILNEVGFALKLFV